MWTNITETPDPESQQDRVIQFLRDRASVIDQLAELVGGCNRGQARLWLHDEARELRRFASDMQQEKSAHTGMDNKSSCQHS